MSHATGRNGQQLVNANHYEVMGLAPTASKAQVRARFLKLVRLVSVCLSVFADDIVVSSDDIVAFPQHHPDKVNGNAGPSSPSSSSSSSSSLIHQLYAAHEVLCNDDLRAQYDAELAQGRGYGSGSSKASTAATPPRVSATLDLDSFEAVADDGEDPSEPVIFEHPCRCGSKYVVSADDLLVDGFDLVECYGCSEVVRVAWRDKEEGEGDR